MKDSVFVIASWESSDSTSIRLQDFMSAEGSFIPIFSNEDAFKLQTRGSGFESQGVEIDRLFLCSILRGDETLILDPGGTAPQKITKADLLRMHTPP